MEPALPNTAFFTNTLPGRNAILHIPGACETLKCGTLRPDWVYFDRNEPTMSKRARKRRSRKGNAANHGRKPNA